MGKKYLRFGLLLFCLISTIFLIGSGCGNSGNSGNNGEAVIILSIRATSPHNADGQDASQVTVTAEDANGNPVIGAEIVVTTFAGDDVKVVFPTQDNGDGTYTALVVSTVADTVRLRAEATTPSTTARTDVIFNPGPVTEVRVIDVTLPRESESKTTAEIAAAALDAFGNVVGPPEAELEFETDLGEVVSIEVDEKGDFIAELFSTSLGTATVTVTDTKTGFSDTVIIDFPPLHLELPPEGSLGVGDTFAVPVTLFVPGPADTPPWEVSVLLDFDSTILKVTAVDDGDPDDSVPSPIVTPTGTGIVLESGSETTEYPFDTPIDFAIVQFEVLAVGTSISADIVFAAKENEIIFVFQALFDIKITDLPENKICMKFWIAPGTFADNAAKEKKLKEDKDSLVEVFKKNVKNGCPNFKFSFFENLISDADWKKIDKNNDGILEEFRDVRKPTEEEKELLKNREDTIDGLRCINAYYVPDMSDGSFGEAFAPGKTVAGNGVVVNGSGPNPSTFPHEIAHFIGDLRDNRDNGNLAKKPNLMVQSNRRRFELTENQCIKITEGKKSFESIILPTPTPTPPPTPTPTPTPTATPTPTTTPGDPELSVDKMEFDFLHVVNSNLCPQKIGNLTIRNTGTETLSWNINESIPWMDVSQTQGELGEGEEITVMLFFNCNVNPNIDQMLAGEFTVTSNGGEKTIKVTGMVDAP